MPRDRNTRDDGSPAGTCTFLFDSAVFFGIPADEMARHGTTFGFFFSWYFYPRKSRAF
jgi:hypothetical protein